MHAEMAISLESKAGAASAPQLRETIAGTFNPCQKLMARVGAAVVMAILVMLALQYWHSSARGLADVQRSAVSAEYFYG